MAAIGTTWIGVAMERGQKIFLLCRFLGSSAKKHTKDFIGSGHH